MTLTWFCFYEVVWNDPGRLIAVHIMHFSNICDWSSSMAVCKLAVFDPSDTIFNSIWYQDQFELPLMALPGVASSWGTRNIEGVSSPTEAWSLEAIAASYSCFSGCLVAAAIDAAKLLCSSLALSGLSAWCLYYYPGIWLKTAYGITGGVSLLQPTWGIEAFASGIAAHYIASGVVGLVVGIFHLCIYLSLDLCSYRMRVTETVLASSPGLIAWAITVAGTMWYGSAMTPVNGMIYNEAWSTLPLRLLFYEWRLGHNPAKVVELIYLWASSTRFGTFLTNSQKILLKRGGTQTDAQKNTAQTGWYALLIFQCEFNAIWYIFAGQLI
jgi:photosystem II CP47 chlorophyll apoprotein